MNKYIKTDIQNSVSQMKVALMNVIYDIESGEENEIDLGKYISWPLFLNCLNESKWIRCYDRFDFRDFRNEINLMKDDLKSNFRSYWNTPSNKFVCIQGSLEDQNFIIKVEENHEYSNINAI